MFKILECLLVHSLLFVNHSKAKVDFVALLKVGVHFQDSRESLLSVFVGAISIVEDANAIPQVGIILRLL